MQAIALRRVTKWRAIGLGLCLSALAVPATASTKGKISGTVLDKQKKPVVAATVAVVGQPFGAFTDAKGPVQHRQRALGDV